MWTDETITLSQNKRFAIRWLIYGNCFVCLLYHMVSGSYTKGKLEGAEGGFYQTFLWLRTVL